MKTETEYKSSRIIISYSIFLTAVFFLTVPIGVLYEGGDGFLADFARILGSPSRLVTDYFALGGLGAAFFNAALCGLLCNISMLVFRVHANATTMAGYLLVVAHCFYGLNILNMLPPFVGVLVYCIVTKRKIAENLHIAFFATALAPFISELALSYTISGTRHPLALYAGIAAAVLTGLISGFIVPALLPGTTKMHRGFNMYKAGLAIGIMGIFVYSFMYKTLGASLPEKILIDNPQYYALDYAYRGFMNVFFVLLFLFTAVGGFFMNGRSLKGYRELLRDSGYGTDFSDHHGMPLCFVNFGVYGLCILAYLNLIFILPELFPVLPQGVGFTGATVGVTFAALTFFADGQHPKNVFPIVVGYILLFLVVCVITLAFKGSIPWTLSTQAYINGLAFATGLCPMAGKYGFKVGVAAGFVSAIICTSTADMHGGFVLYNGGFTAGLTALVMIPILDFYGVKGREAKKEKKNN